LKPSSVVAAAAALGLVALAVVLSHAWGAKGLDPIYVILALGVLVLAVPSTRSWLSEATNLKLPGGFEISRQVEDAVAAAAVLPDASEGSEASSARELKLLKEDWRVDPGSAIATLQATLDSRLRWTEREYYGGARKPNSSTISQLKEDGLIRPDQARFLEAANEFTTKTVTRSVNRGGESKERMERFLEEADRMIYSLRLISLDQKVRQELAEAELALIDLGGQPRSRWPDFYVFDPSQPSKGAIRVTVRIVVKKESPMLEKIRKRLKKTGNESPLDPATRSVIVIPKTSRTEPEIEAEVPAMHRNELVDYLAN